MVYILYTCIHLSRELSKRDVFINQFPYEHLITVKDLIAVISRRAALPGHSHPRWCPITFNLNRDISEFICHFQKRAEK